jgi:hypothetical protein
MRSRKHRGPCRAGRLGRSLRASRSALRRLAGGPDRQATSWWRTARQASDVRGAPPPRRRPRTADSPSAPSRPRSAAPHAPPPGTARRTPREPPAAAGTRPPEPTAAGQPAADPAGLHPFPEPAADPIADRLADHRPGRDRHPQDHKPGRSGGRGRREQHHQVPGHHHPGQQRGLQDHHHGHGAGQRPQREPGQCRQQAVDQLDHPCLSTGCTSRCSRPCPVIVADAPRPDEPALDPFVTWIRWVRWTTHPASPTGTPGTPTAGFETVTSMLDEAFRHQDSNGGGGRITDGDTRWMTAGVVVLPPRRAMDP